MGIEGVHQLHDCRDARVEVPAALEVVADALDGLVKFALDRACLWRERSCEQRLCGGVCGAWGISHHKAVDAAEEPLDAFDAGILPVEIAVGRSGEEAIETRGIGAVA